MFVSADFIGEKNQVILECIILYDYMLLKMRNFIDCYMYCLLFYNIILQLI